MMKLHSSLIHPHDTTRNETAKLAKDSLYSQQQWRPQQELERGGGGGGRRNGPSAAALRKPLQNHQHPTHKTAALGFLHIRSTFRTPHCNPLNHFNQSVAHQSGTHIVCGASGRAGGGGCRRCCGRSWDSPSSCLVSAASSSALVSKHSITHTGAYPRQVRVGGRVGAIGGLWRRRWSEGGW